MLQTWLLAVRRGVVVMVMVVEQCCGTAVMVCSAVQVVCTTTLHAATRAANIKTAAVERHAVVAKHP